jgi:hypothetical protein
MHVQKTLTRAQAGGNGIARVAVPELGTSGLLHGVVARCSDAVGGESATVFLGRRGTLANPPIDGDLTYESAATVFVLSATTADLRDPLPFPYAYKSPGALMDLAFIVTGMGASDFTLVIDIDAELDP